MKSTMIAGCNASHGQQPSTALRWINEFIELLSRTFKGIKCGLADHDDLPDNNANAVWAP